MATFTAGTSFTDGVTGDVTAAKLNALVANATPLSNFITDRTAETSIATDDLVLISDTSDSGALNKMTVANLMKAEMTGTINSTAGTITTLNSTTGTITTGVIPTLTSTTLITSGTGTAAAPAIVPTGDTNTGIFFPAADTIAFSEGGTESMRIDSSGNVGIGVSSLSDKFTVRGTTGVAATIDMSSGISTGTEYGSLKFTASSPNFTGAEIRGIHTNGGTNLGVLAFHTSATERLRIDSSGRVGIGTTSPAYNLDVRGSNNVYLAARATGSANNTTAFIRADTDGIVFGQTGTSATPIIFDQAGTERLRITSGGEVYIAGTTDQGAYNLQVNGTGVWGAGAYVNGSDERLKENIQDITSGLDVVEKLRPVSFQYKEEYTADRSIQSGFIAQDLLVALEGKNYLEGVVSQGPTYYNVAYQNLIPILAKAIQELKTINNSQAQTITSLESRITALEAA